MVIDIFPPLTLNRHLGTLTISWVVPLLEFKFTPNSRLPSSSILILSELDKKPRDFSPLISYPSLYRIKHLPRGLTTANFDWKQLSPSSIGFSPLNPSQKNACSQNLCGPPPLVEEVSPCSGLDRSVSAHTPVTSALSYCTPYHEGCELLLSL